MFFIQLGFCIDQIFCLTDLLNLWDDSFRLFQVLVDGNVNTYVIRGLSTSSEYEVLLAAIYSNEVESDEVILLESTGKLEEIWSLNCPVSSDWSLKLQVWCFANCFIKQII